MTRKKTERIKPRDRIIAALELQEPLDGVIPHYEFQFQLEKEITGKAFNYRDNDFLNITGRKRLDLLKEDAERYIEVAERLEMAGIRVHVGTLDDSAFSDELEIVRQIKKIAGGYLFVQGCILRGTLVLPNEDVAEFCYRMVDDPDGVKREAKTLCAGAIERAHRYADIGADGVDEFGDYCFNYGCFFTPAQFQEFVAPYLGRIGEAVKETGMWFLKHQCGNVLPILENLLKCSKMDALQGLQPVGKTSITAAKELVGDRLCLMGNVDCGLLIEGPEERIAEDTMRALKEGSHGGGFVLMSSCAISFDVPLSHYMAMHDTWKSFCKEAKRKHKY